MPSVSDVQAFAVGTHCLHHEVHVRMWLVGVKHHRIPMFEPKFLPGKVLHRR
jgi:hypothetical protein